jgi:hypothetical protein
MTTRRKLEDSLFKLGMFKEQAHDVVKIAMPEIDKQMNDYRVTWERPASEYPDVFHKILLFKAKPFAFKWYEDNLPNAWNKDLFKT